MSHALLFRHPELVSGPIVVQARSQRWQAQPHGKVRPMRIALVNKVDLPLPMPSLELLFTGNGMVQIAKHLKINESVDIVFGCVPRQRIVPMLPKPASKIRCHTDVKRAVVSAGKNVGAGLPLVSHGPVCAAKWVLKQVQDAEVLIGDNS